MPSPRYPGSLKTEAAELSRRQVPGLSFGFGILGFNSPLGLNDKIDQLYRGSLLVEKYTQYEGEFLRNQRLYQKFIELGLILRRKYFTNVDQIVWTGPQQQAAAVAVAKDLFVPGLNTPISVKNDSRVVANPSPYNIFRSLPSGMVVASCAADWFTEKDYPGIQALYLFVRDLYPRPLPESIVDFYRETGRNSRKDFQSFIAHGLRETNRSTFLSLYRNMCHNVAKASADEFNNNLSSLRLNARSAVFESIVKQFFRINAVPYILAGLDVGREFAVKIPDLTLWKSQWELLSVKAEPDLSRGQSFVYIQLEFGNKTTRERHTFLFHIEIRWSHGKFCGNPEGKLYKEFNWSSVPFYSPIVP